MEELLRKALNNYNIKFDENQLNKLVLLYDLLIEYNKNVNLTSIVDVEGYIYKHIIDSLLPNNEIKSNSKIIDIGAGAGFPSIPIAILRGDINITAVDSVGKKTKFIETIKEKLELNNLEIVNDRIENMASQSHFRENFDFVLARAVAPLNTLIEYSVPFLKVNGSLIAYKSIGVEEEIKISKNAFIKLSCSLLHKKYYEMPEIKAKRAILIIVKNSKTKMEYPRKNNKPRLQPII